MITWNYFALGRLGFRSASTISDYVHSDKQVGMYHVYTKKTVKDQNYFCYNSEFHATHNHHVTNST